MIVTPEPYAGHLHRHPDNRPGSPMLRYEPAIPEERNRRGTVTQPARAAHVVLCGPLGGQLACNPERLRYEAHRLLDAADTLEDHLRADRAVTTIEVQGSLL